MKNKWGFPDPHSGLDCIKPDSVKGLYRWNTRPIAFDCYAISILGYLHAGNIPKRNDLVTR